MLEETDFKARWEAALALRKEKEAKAHSGTDHIKASKKNKKIKNQDSTPTSEPISPDTPTVPKETPDESQENPEIDPKQSLFDSHRSESLKKNVEYMEKKYGFFLPDQECLVDLEGLLGYSHVSFRTIFVLAIYSAMT